MTRLTRLTLRAVLMLGLLSSGVLAAPASTPQSTGAQALNRCSDSQTGGTPATANVRIRARGGCMSFSPEEDVVISLFPETDVGKLVNAGIPDKEINKLMFKLDPGKAQATGDLPTKLMSLQEPTRDMKRTYSELISKVVWAQLIFSRTASRLESGEPNPLTPVLNKLQQDLAKIQ
ncbi:hypothetical protein FB446DRAFT_790884 [Lentinula raphanica]|nr:hypothetical protein FB446DRAFT_790884 [Lentinula raphanica]